MGWRDDIIDATDPRLPLALEERARTGRFTGELTLIHRNGHKFPGEVSSALFKDHEGFNRTSTVIRDITERKQAEEVLRESEARHRFLVTNTSDYIARFDRNAILLFASESSHRFHGYEVDEIVNTSGFEQIHPYDRDRARAAFQSVIETGVDGRLEYRVKSKDGRYIWVESSGRRVYNEAGEAEAVIVMRDITERKQAEEKIKRAASFPRLNPNPILEVDVTTREITFSNEAAHAILFEVGLTDLRAFLPVDMDELMRIAAPNTPTEYHCEIILGSRVFSEAVDFTPEFNAIRIYAVDITERRRAENAVWASLREKQELLKEIHDRVKNNLQIISSLLHLQSRKTNDPAMLEILRESQNRVHSMALAHEKMYQSNNLAQINFGEYVRSLVTSLQQTYPSSRATVSLRFEMDTIFLPLKIIIPCGLIINELVTNVFKYAFPNNKTGSLLIDARQTTAGMFTLRVVDDGVGLPPDLNIYNKRTLGLQLVNTLVGQLEGVLEIESNNGVECTISFRAELGNGRLS